MCIGNLLGMAALPSAATAAQRMGALFGNGTPDIKTSIATLRERKNPSPVAPVASFGAKQAAYKNALSAGVIR